MNKLATSPTTTKKPKTAMTQQLSHDRCNRYLDVVFGGSPDKWL
jgi:hypothetical protein